MEKILIRFIGASVNVISLFSPHSAARYALKLFSTPRKGRLTDQQIPVVESAYYDALTLDHHTIATYRWVGTNKTILLVHGWESNATRWHDLIKLLKAHNHTIIALDAPAHGKSGGKEFNAILYSKFINHVLKKYKPEIIIGHSVGGLSSIFCLHQNESEFVDKLIMLGSPAHFRGVFMRYMSMMNYNQSVERAASELIKERFGNYPDHYSIESFADKIYCKTLIVHDKNDPVIPFDDAVILNHHIKGSELFVAENSNHSLKDKSVNEKLLHFINA